MAITVQSSSSTAFASTTTLTLNKPSGTVDGDLLIAVTFSFDRDMSTVPSGWTLIKTQSIGGINYHNTYYKVAASEGASWDWVIAAVEVFGGAVLRIDGQASTYLDVNASADTSNDDTPSFANTITPSEKFSMLVFSVTSRTGSVGGTSDYAIANDDPTWTEQIDLEGSGASLAIATAIRTEKTATGNSSVTLPSGGAGAVDSSGIIFNLLQDVPQTGTTALLEMNTSSIFVPTSSSGSNVTTDLLEMNSTINVPTSKTKDKRWTDETRTSNTWTDQTR